VTQGFCDFSSSAEEENEKTWASQLHLTLSMQGCRPWIYHHLERAHTPWDCALAPVISGRDLEPPPRGCYLTLVWRRKEGEVHSSCVLVCLSLTSPLTNSPSALRVHTLWSP
jgi:hypothetical protein